ANAHAHARRYDEALADLNRALVLKPDDPEAFLARGIIRGKRHEPQSAIEDFDQAIRLDPQYAEAFCCRGEVSSSQLKHYERAVRDFTQALTLRSDLIDAYFQRCITYKQLGKYELALLDCYQVIQRDPEFVGGYNERGDLYIHLNQLDRALGDFNHVVQIAPHAVANEGQRHTRSGEPTSHATGGR